MRGLKIPIGSSNQAGVISLSAGRGVSSLRFLEKGLIRIKLFLVYFVIQPIKFYQRAISLRLSPTCRFYPSCSHYFIQAIRHFGLLKGSCRGIFRILRCNPFSSGGYDPLIGEKNNESRPS